MSARIIVHKSVRKLCVRNENYHSCVKQMNAWIGKYYNNLYTETKRVHGL